MATSGWDRALDMAPTSRLMIHKLNPLSTPNEKYRWVLARFDGDAFEMAIIDQFLTFADAIAEVDNIKHLIEEGKL